MLDVSILDETIVMIRNSARILRFVAAALVILIVPAWWFWPPREWTHPTATNLSSYSLLLAGLLLSYALSRNLTRFPGERSKLSVIPVSAIGLGLPLVFAAMLCLPYSVYYLAAYEIGRASCRERV